MRTQRAFDYLPACLLGFSALPLAGCLTPIDLAANAGLGVAQAGTSIYSQGTLQAAFSEPMERVVAAVRGEMESLQYPGSFQDLRAETATLTFTQTDGSAITIKAKRSSSAVTGLSIRVGFWGEPAISRLILDRVRTALEAAGPTPAPDPVPLSAESQ